MQAMIFAAGLGTRLKPLTDRMPKALVPVCGKPLLAHTIERLKGAGADEIVVNVHHFSQQIVDYLATHDFGIRIKISDESDRLLDTGGGLRKALPLFSQQDQPVLIHNVDILSNIPLADFYASHQENDATLLVSERQTSRYLLFDDKDRLVGWTNINTGEVKSPYKDLDVASCRRYAFSGIHCFSPRLGRLMTDLPDKFSIIDFYLSVCDKAVIKGHFQKDLRLLDVGKLDSLEQAERFLEGII